MSLSLMELSVVRFGKAPYSVMRAVFPRGWMDEVGVGVALDIAHTLAILSIVLIITCHTFITCQRSL